LFEAAGDRCVGVWVLGSLPAGYSEDDGGVDADLTSFTFTGPDYQTSFNGGVTISSIFQVPHVTS